MFSLIKKTGNIHIKNKQMYLFILVVFILGFLVSCSGSANSKYDDSENNTSTTTGGKIEDTEQSSDNDLTSDISWNPFGGKNESSQTNTDTVEDNSILIIDSNNKIRPEITGLRLDLSNDFKQYSSNTNTHPFGTGLMAGDGCYLVEFGNYIYYYKGNDTSIYRARKDGTEEEVIYESRGIRLLDVALLVADDGVYFWDVIDDNETDSTEYINNIGLYHFIDNDKNTELVFDQVLYSLTYYRGVFIGKWYDYDNYNDEIGYDEYLIVAKHDFSQIDIICKNNKTSFYGDFQALTPLDHWVYFVRENVESDGYLVSKHVYRVDLYTGEISYFTEINKNYNNLIYTDGERIYSINTDGDIASFSDFYDYRVLRTKDKKESYQSLNVCGNKFVYYNIKYRDKSHSQVLSGGLKSANVDINLDDNDVDILEWGSLGLRDFNCSLSSAGIYILDGDTLQFYSYTGLSELQSGSMIGAGKTGIHKVEDYTEIYGKWIMKDHSSTTITFHELGSSTRADVAGNLEYENLFIWTLTPQSDYSTNGGYSCYIPQSEVGLIAFVEMGSMDVSVSLNYDTDELILTEIYSGKSISFVRE